MLWRVSQGGYALEDATEELRGDQEIVTRAVFQDGMALQYATEELKGDREIVMQAVSQDGYALQYATEELKGDREIVMQAVSDVGYALQYATEELKGDHEVVMRAVSKNGFALRFASQNLKGDKEMMQHAFRQDPRLIGLKVFLLSGRCCDEIFDVDIHIRSLVLRRCAELLDLDPDHVERSGALMRGTVEVQGREITREHSGLRLRVEDIGASTVLKDVKRASNFKLERSRRAIRALLECATCGKSKCYLGSSMSFGSREVTPSPQPTSPGKHLAEDLY